MISDGFDNVEARTEGQEEQHDDRVIQGERVAFTNEATWKIVSTDEVIDPSREFIFVDVARVVQKFVDQ
jgi:hypothetical protein